MTVMDRKGGRSIIRDINVEIAPGTFVAIIGESGAGKSTLLRALSIQLGKEGDYGDLFLEHAEGRSLVDNHTHDAYLERLSFVPQEEQFIDTLTAEETLRDACTFAGFPASEIGRRCQALLCSVELPKEIHGNRIRTLSGGQKRRLSIARALASEPEILFLDEPTSGLDLFVAQGIMELLEGLCRRNGVTIVCTSHLPSTLTVCDRVLLMSAGEERDGGRIAADFDAASFRAALAAEKTGPGIYRQTNPPKPARVRKGKAGISDIVEMPDGLKEKKAWLHFEAVFERSRKAWWRDRGSVTVFALQPVVLALMVIVTQSLHGGDAGDFIDFFLTVSALWIGMSLCIRDFVSERTLYALDELSGLDEMAYLWAKIGFAVALSVAGVFILCLVAHVGVGAADKAFDIEHAKRQFTIWHFMPRFIILGITGISGALIGLFISLVSRTERAAISLMPLALMPQVVFSRFACGYGTPVKGKEFPFHALTFLKENGTESANGLEWTNYIASLPMTTRHASWSLESTAGSGFEWNSFYWSDFSALAFLTSVQILLVWFAFMLTAKDSLSRIR